MAKKAESTGVDIEGRHLTLSNLDKVLYPDAGFTKAKVIDYYARIAAVMLPHLRGRPMTLVRFPDGVEKEPFFEKNCPKFRPEWVRTEAVYTGRRHGSVNHCVIDDLPTLIWVANLAALELHPNLAYAVSVDHPTGVVFDLDPGAPAGIVECCRVAIRLRDLFTHLGRQVVVKTSGSKGLHIGVPLNRPDYSYADTKPFAAAIAASMTQRFPEEVTDNMRKDLRVGRVFIDWSQNTRHKTTVAPYSLRGRARPSVSTPVSWDEVEAALATGDASKLHFEADAVLDRVSRMGDLFAGWVTVEQGLPEFAGS